MRVAVVTGSNKGIGFAVVQGLCAKFDGDVYLTSRDVGRGTAAIAELKQQGVEAKFHQLDIDDIASIKKLRDHLAATYGGLDVLVNNAAIAFKHDSTVPFGEQAKVTLATNYTANLNVCKILFPLLRPHARVVNVSSSLGQLSSGVKSESLRNEFKSDALTESRLTELVQQFVDDAVAGEHIENGWGGSAYSLSKVAITALTRIQQREFNSDSRTDIIVTAVEPGYVNTDMTSHKGNLLPEQGADPIIHCSLLPSSAVDFKGAYVSQTKGILKWE